MTRHDAALLRKQPESIELQDEAPHTDWFSVICFLIMGLVIGAMLGVSFQPQMVTL